MKPRQPSKPMRSFQRFNPAFDSTHVAPGVRVQGVPTPKAHISQAQTRLARTPETNHKGELLGVLKVHMIGGAQGLGMISTVNTARVLCNITPSGKGCAPGTVRPGSRRRGHAKRPKNLCFGRPIPSNRAYELQDHEKLLAHLRQFDAHLESRAHVPEGLEDKYQALRVQLVRTSPAMAQRVAAMELQHRKTIRVPKEVLRMR